MIENSTNYAKISRTTERTLTICQLTEAVTNLTGNAALRPWSITTYGWNYLKPLSAAKADFVCSDPTMWFMLPRSNAGKSKVIHSGRLGKVHEQ